MRNAVYPDAICGAFVRHPRLDVAILDGRSGLAKSAKTRSNIRTARCRISGMTE